MSALYERLPNESDPAWAAFVLYRDMEERTGAAVAKTVGKSPQMVHRWSSKNLWVKRARAWDMERDRRMREAELRAVEKMRARHIDLAVSMQGIGVAQLKKLAEAAEKTPSATLRTPEILALLEEGTKLERLSRGEPGEITQQAAAKKDLSALSTDELKMLKRVGEKARGGGKEGDA